LLLAFSLTQGFSAFGRAQTIQSFDLSASSHSSFRKLIDAGQKTCVDLHCANAAVTAQAMTKSEMSALDKETLQKLNTLCERMAEAVWPDTILEGPYVASFQVKITHIEALIQTSTKKMLGYRLTYTDQAWDTDHCDYDPTKPNSLRSCEPGFLVESLFVSTSTDEAFRDAYGSVEFTPSK
jgi:hypothetical protein